MIREKSLLRKQICVAINQNDYETARNIMNTICKNEQFTRRKWLKDEAEFLMHHVEALGFEKACKVVAKKFNRTVLGTKKKYRNEIKKLNEKEFVTC